MRAKPEWEVVGAGSGLLATLAFIASLIITLTTDPTGSPPLPDLDNAEAAPAFIAANLNAFRFELLLLSLGTLLFLWFLASLSVSLRQAEGEPGRGASATVIAASVASALILVSAVLGFTMALTTSPSQAASVPALYAASALSFSIAGGALALFFFGVARAVLRSNALPKWLGIFAFVAGFLCVIALVSPFFSSGPFNAATGLLGHWLWFVAFVVWLLLASILMLAGQRQQKKEPPAPAPDALSQSTGIEGENA